jgi:hypothetical protein
MSNNKTDGGPAFPHTMMKGHKDYAGGMSLRDYFAGQAITGIMASLEEGGTLGAAAAEAYNVADRMLVERSKL